MQRASSAPTFQLALIGALFAFLAVPTAPSAAQEGGEFYGVVMAPLNGSEATGTASVRVQDGRMMVQMTVGRLSPGLPHPQHLHLGGAHRCPETSADEDGDGYVSAVEGMDEYGPIRFSLTTQGDTSPASALAMDRFPRAGPQGAYSYGRTIDLPPGVTAGDIGRSVVVVHGMADITGDPDQYDGAKRSSLDPDLPFEATVPVLCGRLLGPAFADDAPDGA